MKHENLRYPTLIMVRGLPGSGKTYLATRLEQAIGKDQVVLLDPDTVDLADKEYLSFSNRLDEEGLDKAIHPFRWSRQKACEAIFAHKIVIWNQPFTNRGIFERLVAFLEQHAKEQGMRLPVLVVEVEIDPDVAKQRIAKRKQDGGHGPSDDTFARRVSEYKSYADSFKTVIVNGQDDVAVSLAAVMKGLQDLSAAR